MGAARNLRRRNTDRCRPTEGADATSPMTERDFSPWNRRVDNIHLLKQAAMVLEYSLHRRWSKNKSLAAILLLGCTFFRAHTYQRQPVVTFGKSNSGGLTEFRIFNRWKLDDQPPARDRRQLMNHSDWIIQMMKDVEQTNVVELLVDRLLDNITLLEFDCAPDDLFEQTSLAKSFSVKLDA